MRSGFVAVGVSVLVNALASPPFVSLRVLSTDDVVRISVFAVIGVIVSAFVGAAGELQLKVDLERERLAVTLTCIGDAVVATDAEGRVTFLNPVAEHATGWKLDEAYKLPLETIFVIVNETTRATVPNPVRKVLEQGRIVGLANHTLLIRRDGSEIPIDDSAAPIRGANGIEGVVLVFRDITETKATQSALLRSEKLASVGRLASTIAHEINNPLESVSNLLYLVEKDPNLSATSKDYVASAQSELGRAAELTKQTLSFHKGTNFRTAVNVRECVESVLKIYASRARNNDVEVRNEVSTDIYVHVIRTQFRQLVSNFVTNAIDAMPQGGTFTVCGTVPGMGEDMTVELSFIDTGHGIAKDHLPRIFDPFFTTKADVGTGLGLWVTKTIVNDHDGHISVHSDTTAGGSGTTFIVTLPVTEPQAKAAGQSPS